MSLIMNLLVLLLVVVGNAALFGTAPLLAQTISLDIQQGEVGDVVPLTIRVNAIPNVIDAFGFDVVYDHQVLQYAGQYVRGTLSDGFDFFEVNEIKTGQVRVGGFTTRNQIDKRSSGPLATLAFTVVNPGNATLRLSNLMDDVVSWSAPSTRFEVVSSQTSDTASENSTPQPSDGQTSDTASGNSRPQTSAGQTIETALASPAISAGSGLLQPTNPDTATQPQQQANKNEQPSTHPTYRSQTKSGRTYHATPPLKEPFFPPMRRSDSQTSFEWQKQQAGKPTQHVPKNNASNRSVMSAQRYNATSMSLTTPQQTTSDQRRNAESPPASGHSVINGLLSGAALMGIIIVLLLQRKELALQRKALHVITEEMKHISHARGQIERAFRRHTADAFSSARLNALSMLLKVEIAKTQVNNSKMAYLPNGTVSFDEDEESIQLDHDKINEYLAAIESELKKT